MRLDGLYIYFIQFFHEEIPVLRIHDGLDRSSKHLDGIFLENAILIELDSAVQGRLAAE